jgi:hypothetical protein
MSNPNEQQRERDELELDAETVSDLDVSEPQSDEVRGGCLNGSCYTTKPR